MRKTQIHAEEQEAVSLEIRTPGRAAGSGQIPVSRALRGGFRKGRDLDKPERRLNVRPETRA